MQPATRKTTAKSALTAALGLAVVGLFGANASAALIDEAVVFYTFEESGQTVNDVSGTTAIDLQLGSTSGSDSEDPTRTTGYNGSGLSYDGDDFATSDADVDALDFNGDEAFSVAGWMKRTDGYAVQLFGVKDGSQRRRLSRLVCILATE